MHFYDGSGFWCQSFELNEFLKLLGLCWDWWLGFGLTISVQCQAEIELVGDELKAVFFSQSWNGKLLVLRS